MRRTGIIALLALLLSGCGDERAPVGGEGVGGLSAALGGDPDPGFARATEIRPFAFPHDHGAHPAFRNEWWYVTGNLDDGAGRRYGFQLTLFRIGLAPGRAQRASAWATHQVWMGHLALTDVAGGRFHAAERFARGGDLGLAGAARDPVRIWLEDWRLERGEDGDWQIAAATDTFALELALRPQKPPVPQGERGLSRKSDEPGNASYYYSLPRLAVDGAIRVAGERRPVRGHAWLDREWSTSALGAGQVGWDWFALQLDDGRDLMVYRLRRRDGATDPHSAGSLIGPDGVKTALDHRDVAIEVLERWTSPRGTTYPARWRLDAPGLDGPLTVVPVLPDQELDLSVRYWEGAVDVLRDGEPVGRGYVELAGYAED
ncbi:MAG: lipocalin-like domain-containing protein [Halofilum sp. (in: g-proteobacteria)]|nr:lipocalin-like domain-containing protein [Halofilum sp. (in: g-proteobacteria)]